MRNRKPSGIFLDHRKLLLLATWKITQGGQRNLGMSFLGKNDGSWSPSLKHWMWLFLLSFLLFIFQQNPTASKSPCKWWDWSQYTNKKDLGTPKLPSKASRVVWAATLASPWSWASTSRVKRSWILPLALALVFHVGFLFQWMQPHTTPDVQRGTSLPQTWAAEVTVPFHPGSWSGGSLSTKVAPRWARVSAALYTCPELLSERSAGGRKGVWSHWLFCLVVFVGFFFFFPSLKNN